SSAFGAQASSSRIASRTSHRPRTSRPEPTRTPWRIPWRQLRRNRHLILRHMSDSYTSEGDRIVKCRDQLKAQYTPLTNHIRELSNLYAPFEINGDAITVYPWTDSMMFDSTPRQAASICANGLSSLVAPRTEEWFEWAPPFGMNDDEATSWFRECSAIARQV